MRNYMDVSRIWREELAEARKKHPLQAVSMKLNGRLSSTLGRACSRTQQVELNKAAALQFMTEEELRQVIRHELAHLCAGYHAGHGPEWQRWARALGCSEKHVAPKVETTNGRAMRVKTQRRTRQLVACEACGRPASIRNKDAKYLMNGTWKPKCRCGGALRATGEKVSAFGAGERRRKWENSQEA